MIILIANILSSAFKGVLVLDNYYFWLGVFVITASALSFSSQLNNPYVSKFIALMRIVMICCMVIVPIMEIDRNGFSYSLSPKDSTGHENSLF
jgi:hypothetical protein